MISEPFNATEAKANLHNFIGHKILNHQPLFFAGEDDVAVFLAEEDWNTINETLYLLSVLGMRGSVI